MLLKIALIAYNCRCPDEVNFAEIYSYLASIVKNQEDQPPMSSQSATCLLNAVENIEKQAEIVMNAELEEELTERYATLIGNTKIVPEKLRRRSKGSDQIWVLLCNPMLVPMAKLSKK